MAGTAIAVGPGGWVHVVQHQEEWSEDVIWSPDLRSWHVVTPPGGLACTDGGALAASDSTWLLRCGRLFRSTDGRTWMTVGTSGGQVVPVQQLRHIVSDGQGFVAYPGEYPADSHLWTSTDGSSWTRVSLPDTPFVHVDALIARPAGGFVLAGRVAGSADELREAHDIQWYSLPGKQAILTSKDGTAWTAVGLGSAFEDGRITGLAADGPGGGLVAVGYLGDNVDSDANKPPAVWRSSDGRSWQHLEEVASAVARSIDPGVIRAVATADRWLVVGAGLLGDDESEWHFTQPGVIAGSEDGSRWWTIDPIQLRSRPYSITAIIATPDRLVMLGQLYPGGLREDTLIWASPPLG